MGGHIFGLIHLHTFLSHVWQLAGLSQRLWLRCMILCMVMRCPNLGCLFKSCSHRVVLIAHPLCLMLTLSLGCGKSCLLIMCGTV